MATNAAPILIRKKKGGHHEAHHGGAWKVAYADFVTAMMAFFLLLWLLNSTTQEQRSGISEYFAPASVARTTSGAGAPLSGATITLDGPMKGRGAPLGLPVPMPEEQKPDASDADSDDRIDAGPNANKSDNPDFAGKASREQDLQETSKEQLEKILARREEDLFDRAEKSLQHVLENTPGLRKLRESLIVDRTEEGLRIQMVDHDKTEMFAKGSAEPYQHTRQLLEAVSQVIAQLPNKVSIVGHTDAAPYANDSRYTNWELSTDRAHASRRQLIHFGLDPDRIARVSGKAATEPLLPGDPYDARNRRISITLLRQAAPPPGVVPDRAQATPPAPPAAPNPFAP